MSENLATELSAGAYIRHHLNHFQSGTQSFIVDFSVFNLDTIFWSSLLGFLGIFLLWRVAKNFSIDKPSRLQLLIEVVFDLVYEQTKSIIHTQASRLYVGSLALTIFVWVFLMNAMDFLPLDLFPRLWEEGFKFLGHDASHAYMRVVPTADLSATLGMSLGVLIVCIYYNIKIKGLVNWVHELFTAPFGSKLFLYPVNFLLQMIEFMAKTVSHGMRLFGNMFAGELVFMLIALMGASLNVADLIFSGIALWLAQILIGSLWAIFHILIVALQAFIFMMLALVYVGQAHEKH